MNNNIKTKILIWFFIFISCISILSCKNENNTKTDSQKIYIGEDLGNYRLMDRINTKVYLTSIKKISNTDYEISLRQFYNNNPYDFVFIVKTGDSIHSYFIHKPKNIESKDCFLEISELNQNYIILKKIEEEN